jgi:hypothetical protein
MISLCNLNKVGLYCIIRCAGDVVGCVTSKEVLLNTSPLPVRAGKYKCNIMSMESGQSLLLVLLALVNRIHMD